MQSPDIIASSPRSEMMTATSRPVVHHGGVTVTRMSSAVAGKIEIPVKRGKVAIEGSDSNSALHTPVARIVHPIITSENSSSANAETSIVAKLPPWIMRIALSAAMFSGELATVPVTVTRRLMPAVEAASEFLAILKSSSSLMGFVGFGSGGTSSQVTGVMVASVS